MRAVAKGVRKTKSKFGARLEPMSHVRLLLYRGRELDIVSQAESVEPLSPMLSSLDRASQGMAAIEAVDQLSLEREPNPRLYRMLVGVLRTIAERPVAAERAGVLLEAARRRGARPAARRVRALRRVEPDVPARRLRPRRGRCAVPGVPHRARRSAPAALAIDARHPRRPAQRGAWPARSRRSPTRSARSRPAPSNTTSSATSAPSPCSNATEVERGRGLA